MKTAFKANLFNTHNFEVNTVENHRFKVKKIESQKLSVIISELVNIIGLRADYNMAFMFDTIGSVKLYVNQKVDISVGEFDLVTDNKLTINNAKEINLGAFKFDITDIIDVSKDYIDIDLRGLLIEAKTSEILKTSADISLTGISFDTYLLYFVKSGADVNIGEFGAQTYSVETISNIQTISLNEVSIDVNTAHTLIKQLFDVALNEVSIDVSFKESLKSGVDININDLSISAFLINGIEAFADIPVKEFKTSVTDNKLNIRQYHALNSGLFDTEFTNPFMSIKDRTDFLFGSIYVDAQFKEAALLHPLPAVMEFGLQSDLINGIQSGVQFNAMEFAHEVIYKEFLFSRPNISLFNIGGRYDCGEVGSADFKTGVVLDMSAAVLNLRHTGADISIGFGFNAEPVVYDLTVLATLDPNTLNTYDDMTLEEMERSVIAE